jgi:TonB family protein
MPEISIACRKDGGPYGDEGDEDSLPERILTVEEFLERLRERTDIFGVDRNRRLRNAETIALFLAALACVWFTSNKAVIVKPEIPLLPVDGKDGPDVTVGNFVIDPRTARVSHPEVPEPAAADNGRRVIRPSQKSIVNNGASNGTGVGSIHSRIVKEGIIGILTGHVIGKTVAGGDFFGKGGFAEGMDAMLSGAKQGLKRGGSGPMVRRGIQSIGFSEGYGLAGINGPGGDGTDEMINNLMTSMEPESPLSLKTRAPVHVNVRVAVPIDGGKISGAGRNRSEIMRVVMQNIGALRYAYNRSLREKPGMKGRITIRFVVDEFGNVINCEVVSSSIDDKELESTVTDKIMRWKFEKIDKPGDITEVVYPFVFST